MSNKEYYAQWLKIKEELEQTLAEDARIQELAIHYIGIKPQSSAVETVARVYCKYCQLYNKMCDCYDQMEQVQRRPYIRKIIDALTCRIVEIKKILEDVEAMEYTYTDNACVQMLIIPQEVEILCPFFYPFETRLEEYQYIMDQIFSGNRIGDITPSPSEIFRREEEKRLEEERIREEKEAEIKRLLTLGFDLPESSIKRTPSELEEIRIREEYENNVFNIQRMERARFITKEKAHKKHKDENLYLELAGLKKPPPREALRNKAANMIQVLCRRFMQAKREHIIDYKLKEKLGMVIPAFKPPSAKEQLEKVKEARRNFRKNYYEQWVAKNITEKARVLKFKEGDMIDDISDEIRQWYNEWFHAVRAFDEFPYPNEGGSILIVRGQTFRLDEYVEWKDAEEKRLKAEAGQPKSADQIKQEKLAARAEKKRLALEAKEREKKRIIEYKKSRMNPDNDPGVFINIGYNIDPLVEAWKDYQVEWRTRDEPNPDLDVIRGMIQEMITQNAYQQVNLELRPIVDETLRIEYERLKNAMKADYASVNLPPPLVKKRKKGRKPGKPKPEKIPPRVMFQQLADAGIVRTYPHVTFDDIWGERNYAAADCRGILWTPTFPPACVGDVREQVRIRCMLTLGSSCPGISRSQLIVGPRDCGKKSLVYAVATETNSLLMDLSPLKVYDKFPGPKDTKVMWTYINKISRMMQPTIIFVENAEKMFYKAVPKEERDKDPTRLSKEFFKQVLKPLGPNDKIIVIGTAMEPWLAKAPLMSKVFPDTIMIPRVDYGSISFIMKQMLMERQGVDRDFNVHSISQILRGYNLSAIKKVINTLVSGKRLAELTYKPLHPMEILEAILTEETAFFRDPWDEQMYLDWYVSYSPFGEKLTFNKAMLESQLIYKLKAEKKKKG